MEMYGRRHSPAAVTHCIGDWVGGRAGLDRCGNLAPTGIRFPDRPARSESLYRLPYPSPQKTHYVQQNTSVLWLHSQLDYVWQAQSPTDSCHCRRHNTSGGIHPAKCITCSSEWEISGYIRISHYASIIKNTTVTNVHIVKNLLLPTQHRLKLPTGGVVK
jgi:hypothetical protein